MAAHQVPLSLGFSRQEHWSGLPFPSPRQYIKKQRHYFANKGPSSQGYGFSSSHVWIWELDCKESWAPKNWCFWTVVLENTLESPLESKEIQPVHPKGNQSWTFIGRTDAEAEIALLWPPDVKNWLIWKEPDAGKDGEQEERGNRGWDGWMASPTQWTWVWVGFGSWWWTLRPVVLQSMGSQSQTQLSDWTYLKVIAVLHCWNLLFDMEICAFVLSWFSDVHLFVILWTLTCQALLSMGIIKVRILEWIAMPSCRESSQPRDWIHVSYVSWIDRWVIYHDSHQESPLM